MGTAKHPGAAGDERPAGAGEGEDSRWYPVYLAVIVTTALVIAALWAFSLAYAS